MTAAPLAAPLASMLAEPEGDGDATTARILDAAYGLMEDFGVRNLSVEEVARRAGVARVTIYRRFSGKDELLRAVVLREGRRLFAVVDGVIAACPSPEEQLVEGFAATLSAVRGHPLVARTLDREPEMLASIVVTQGGPMIALAREYLAGHIRQGQRAGLLPGFDARGAAELAVRLSLSFLLTPESCMPLESDADARAFARRYLRPALTLLAKSPEAPA